jgi:hypothetical protein
MNNLLPASIVNMFKPLLHKALIIKAVKVIIIYRYIL